MSVVGKEQKYKRQVPTSPTTSIRLANTPYIDTFDLVSVFCRQMIVEGLQCCTLLANITMCLMLTWFYIFLLPLSTPVVRQNGVGVALDQDMNYPRLWHFYWSLFQLVVPHKASRLAGIQRTLQAWCSCLAQEQVKNTHPNEVRFPLQSCT